jgi:hypothetical protein
MTEGELDSLLFDAYLLGQRVLYETGNVAPVSAKDDTSWDVLCGIAEGTTTIVSGPDKMLEGLPAAPGRAEVMREYLERVGPLVIQHDRELAQRILAGAGRRP